MSGQRFGLISFWKDPPAHKSRLDDEQGDYDFHTFCLELMDVIWSWVFAIGVILVLQLLL